MKRLELIVLLLIAASTISVAAYPFSKISFEKPNPLANVTYDSMFKGFYSANGTEILVGTVGEPVTVLIDVPVGWTTYKGEIDLSINEDVAWAEDTVIKTQKLGDGEYRIIFVPVEATKYPVRGYYTQLESIHIATLQVKEN